MLLIEFNKANAQFSYTQDTTKKRKIYNAWVRSNAEPYRIRGILYEATDSSLIVTKAGIIPSSSINKLNPIELNINNIESIYVRRTNSVGRGLLIGSLSGIVLGGIIGYSLGDDPPCPSSSGWFDLCVSPSVEDKALLFGVPLALVGGLTGALIGSVKIKIPLNSSERNSKLKKYAYR